MSDCASPPSPNPATREKQFLKKFDTKNTAASKEYLNLADYKACCLVLETLILPSELVCIYEGLKAHTRHIFIFS
jgi:hypothetical protein